MHGLNWNFLFLLGALSTQVWAGPNHDVHLKLRAATSKSDLFRRDPNFHISFNPTLSYAEGSAGDGGHKAFFSKVKIGSDVPILVLEDNEQHLSDIRCPAQDKLVLHFDSSARFKAATSTCNGLKGAYAITNHYGCNKPGERTAFRIRDVQVHNDDMTVTLEVAPTSWKKAFRSFSIDYGFSEGYSIREHTDRLYKRAVTTVTMTQTSTTKTTLVATNASGSTGSSTVASSGSFTWSPTLSLPSSTPSATSVTIDLKRSALNKTFGLPDFIVRPGPSVPLQIGCTNCTTFGTLELTQGSFDISIPDRCKNITSVLKDSITNFDIPDECQNPAKFVRGGFVEVKATDIGAHIELFSQPSVSQSLTIKLPFDIPIPFLAFVIPGIGKAGVTFSPEILLAYTVQGGVTLNYGFDVLSAGSSTIRADLSSFNASRVSGFNATTFNTITPTLNRTDITVGLTAAFKPKIPVGFEFFDGQIEAEAGIFMDLPLLNATITPKTTIPVDATCQPLNSTNSTSNVQQQRGPISEADYNNIIKGLGNLTLIEAAAVLDIGVDLNLKAPIAAGVGLAAKKTLLSKDFAMPTQCMALVTGNGRGIPTFTPATALVASATSSLLSASSVSAASVSAASVSASKSAEASRASASAAARPSNGTVPFGGADSVRPLDFGVVGLVLVAGFFAAL